MISFFNSHTVDYCRKSAPNKRSVKEMAKQGSKEAPMGKEDQQNPTSRNKFGNEIVGDPATKAPVLKTSAAKTIHRSNRIST